MDEYAWYTYLLDSMIVASSLLETGKVDLVKRHLARLDQRYLRDAQENARRNLD